MQKLSPIGWALRPFKNYAKFSGRASRAEFWWFTLFVFVIYLVLLLGISAVAGGLARANPIASSRFGGFGLLFGFVGLSWLALLVPSIAVQTRRLHDTNRSGWWLGAFYLLYLVYLLVVLPPGFAGAGVGDPQALMRRVAVGAIIALIFFVYSILLLVLFCLAGTKGSNRFGDDPYGANVEEVFA